MKFRLDHDTELTEDIEDVVPAEVLAQYSRDRHRQNYANLRTCSQTIIDSVLIFNEFIATRGPAHQRWNRVTGSLVHRVSDFDRVGSGHGSVCQAQCLTRF